MKNNLQTNPILFKMAVLITCFMLVILYNKSKAAEAPSVSHAGNRVSVNFKNDVKKNELSISVKSGTNAVLQLFIFSPDGILVEEVAVSTHKITRVEGLKRGYYLYECFNNDERMKSGNLLIK